MSRRHSRYVTIADQIISSVSNFALVIFVARTATPTEFGQFSLGYIVVIFFLGLQRSLVGEVLIVRFSNSKISKLIQGQALGLTVWIALIGALCLFVGSIFASSVSAGIWVALMASSVCALLQDTARFVFITRNESGTALLIDGIWAGLFFAGILAVVLGEGSSIVVVLLWGGSALVALLVGLFMAKSWPRLWGGFRFFRENKDLSIRFSAEYSSLSLSTTLVWFVLAGFLGASGVAALRGASLLFSPLNTGFNAVRIAMIPDLIRTRGTRLFSRRMLETGLVLLTACLVWGITVVLLPDDWGRKLLGATWESAAELRWPYFVQAIAMVGYTVVLAYFRAADLHNQSSWMRGVLAGLTLIIPLTGAIVLASTTAVAWGFALAVGVAALLGTTSTYLHVRNRNRVS